MESNKSNRGAHDRHINWDIKFTSNQGTPPSEPITTRVSCFLEEKEKRKREEEREMDCQCTFVVAARASVRCCDWVPSSCQLQMALQRKARFGEGGCRAPTAVQQLDAEYISPITGADQSARQIEQFFYSTQRDLVYVRD
ncbi:hypothetical protein DPEC_G00313370 [Dallia pectoralis]|uniref:Uncharacterized protein n=1 Tax=Dallia pectoralis TaxID=75939 RepID=A0ACC2FBV6_DALPE|nr:hypothetical protein DPEC_G00313370 [Dallia pectoralis]